MILEKLKNILNPQFLDYFIKWEKMIEKRAFNIAAHKSLYKEVWFDNILHYLIIGFAILLLFQLIRKRNKYIFYLTIIFFLYSFFVLFYINYPAYLTSNDLSLTLQGRYLFPVLGAFVVLFSYSFISLFNNKKIKLAILIILSAFFIWGDFVFFYFNHWIWEESNSNTMNLKQLKDVGRTEKGRKSVYQTFQTNDKEIAGIRVYISTHQKILTKEFDFNLYRNNCRRHIETHPIISEAQQILIDNSYFIIKFNEPLKNNKWYCFNIINVNSDDPVSLKFSKRDLSGHIVSKGGIPTERDVNYELLSKEYFLEQEKENKD